MPASKPSQQPRRRARRHRRAGLAWLAVTAAVGATLTVPVATSAGAGTETDPQHKLETALLHAVRDADFGDTIDYGPIEGLCPAGDGCTRPAGQIKQMPNIDLAVIELDASGKATRAANVLVSRDYPDGIAVPVDLTAGPAGSYGVPSVRWRRWDIERSDGGSFDETDGHQLTTKGWTDNPALTGADDIVAGREQAPTQFMSPYPASLFKLLVAFRIARLIDLGKVKLSDTVPALPAPTVVAAASVAGATGASGGRVEQEVHLGRQQTTLTAASAAAGETVTVAEALDAMMTYSDNDSAKGLIRLLTKLGDIAAMNKELADLGLATLQVNGTNPDTGGNWQPGQIHMTSMDTARLLWLIDGGDGTLWSRPNNGAPVSAALLSPSSRTLLKKLLDEQAYHEALSTTALCHADNVEPGIPALEPTRWLDAKGVVQVDGYDYGHDVRPCNARAEVNFGHKTGLTWNYGSDAGIVTALDGEGGRHYIIAFNSNLGYRYTDKPFAKRTTNDPCDDAVGPICYTQRIPAMARQIDAYLSRSAAK